MFCPTQANGHALYIRRIDNFWFSTTLFYALYVKPNDNGIGHLIYRISMKQILSTMKYKPVSAPENQFKSINEKNTFITKI